MGQRSTLTESIPLVGLLLLGLAACADGAHGGSEARALPGLPEAGDAAALPASSSCPTSKLRFTQATGCRNDGSVEFCLPSGDAAAVAKVSAIAPRVRSGLGRGRAGCAVLTETLYFFPTEEAECVERHGAMKDTAWEELCRIAALPEVREIVPTWFE